MLFSLFHHHHHHSSPYNSYCMDKVIRIPSRCASSKTTARRVKTVASLAEFVQSEECQRIAILTGAGVSVASGIPDFQTMYRTLRPELITGSTHDRLILERDPTEALSWKMFRNNPFPYLELRRNFILGTFENKWKATIAHRFAELLHVKTGKLTRIYTQNIDGLHGQCEQIPDEMIIPVHGSISRVGCESCGAPMPFADFCQLVRTNIKDIDKKDKLAPKKSKPIPCPVCDKPLVKPTTVMYGRSLPAEFFQHTAEDLPNVDLLIVAGTALRVYPANTVVVRVPVGAQRVIVNLEPVGEAEWEIDYSNDEDSRDWFLQGNCDEVFLELIQHLGWVNDLDERLLPEASAEMVRRAKSANQDS